MGREAVSLICPLICTSWRMRRCVCCSIVCAQAKCSKIGAYAEDSQRLTVKDCRGQSMQRTVNAEDSQLTVKDWSTCRGQSSHRACAMQRTVIT
eukprot:1143858-Pelagomonas_calceolata.AAC.8